MTTQMTTVIVKANPDLDDCLAGAVEQYVAEHPEAKGWDLSPRFADETREEVLLTVPRTADMWWAWHDQDSSRWSTDVSDAEQRCAAWVAGESNDGPSN